MTTNHTMSALAAQFQLRNDITFLNHGSFGACPLPVFETYQRWQRELESDPVDFFARRRGPLLAEARARLAAFVGTEADQVVYVKNATEGVNIIARSLELGAGDEVLSTNHEYGAVDRTWRYACAPVGARLVHQPVALPVESQEAVVEQIMAGVTPRTRVIALSHISSPTALVFPVAEICRRARKLGIMTVIDGAHAPGQVDLALDEMGADFYVGNCHKWLCAPKGAGFLYARAERQALLRPLIISWGWESETPGPSLFIDHLEMQGTADPSAYLAVPAAIDFQTQNNWSDVRGECHALLAEASERIGAFTGLPPISFDDTRWWVQMRSIPLPAGVTHELGKQLWERYRIEVPIVVWHGQPFVRVSIQAYNTERDIDTLVTALEALL